MADSARSNLVYDYIIESIQSGKWRPGEKITTENDLCDLLGVSRAAVRAALDRLSALGVLEKRKGSGTFVREIDLGRLIGDIAPLLTLQPLDLLDILNFRLYFEPGNVREFMRHQDAARISALQATYDRMVHHAASRGFYLADLEFHREIARGTHNPVTIAISDMLTAVMEQSFGAMYARIGPEIGLRYHQNIMEAINHRETDLAMLLMKRHIEENIARIIQIQQETDDAQTTD